MVAALLIDFDGTLVDSIPLLYESYSALLKQREKQPSQEEFDTLNGFPLRKALKTLIDKHQLDEDVNQLTDDYESVLLQKYTSQVQLTPGAREFLEQASKTYTLAIVTAADTSLVKQVLEKFQIEHYFATVIGGEGLERGKPHPEIYVKALHEIKIPAHKVMAIEDSEQGIQAARSAGIVSIRYAADHSWQQILEMLNETD